MDTKKNLSAETYSAFGELFRPENNNTISSSSLMSQHAGNLLSLLREFDKLPFGVLSALLRVVTNYSATTNDADREQVLHVLERLARFMEHTIVDREEVEAWMSVLRELETEPGCAESAPEEEI
jgi:hypothetical protein